MEKTIKTPIMSEINKAGLYSEENTEIAKALQTKEENVIDHFKLQAKRSNGKLFFQLYFWLHEVSKEKMPEKRILTYNKISKHTGIHRKTVADYVNVLGGLEIFSISEDSGTKGRREKKIILKHNKYWDKGQPTKILSIYNWYKAKWEI